MKNSPEVNGASSFIAYPEHGGRIDKLVLYLNDNPVSILRSLGSEAQVRSDQTYNNTVLFPFANRLEKGEYLFEDIPYRFPANDQQTNYHSALHGLLSNYDFEVTERLMSDNNSFKKLGLRAKLNKSTFSSYPFEVEFHVHYQIVRDNVFRVAFFLRNTGDRNVPAGYGWHPYFSINEPVDELYLKIPRAHRIEVDENLLPTGIKKPDHRFSEEARSLKSESFDTCFQLDGDGPFETSLIAPEQNIRLNIRQSANLPYMQIYTPDDRKTIAIEPVSSNINAFRNKDGLMVLKPGEKVESWIELHLAKAH